MAYELIKSEQIYCGRKISLYKDTISLPNGETGERELIKHNGAAAMIAIDNNGKIIFARQYRHAALRETLEIPAGTLNTGEKPLDCAVRELKEETGYTAGKMEFLLKFYSAIGFCNEVLYIYLATDLSSGTQNTDEDEFIQLERFTLDEAIKMILNGEIIDSKTIAAILAYKQMIS